jgi:hypothetical protein
VVVDVPLIEVDLLVIEGTLEFEYLPTSTVGSDPVYMNHILKANHVVIKGGRLLAGYNKNIYRGSLDIILTGTLASPSYTIEDGPTIGAKALGMYRTRIQDSHTGLPYIAQANHPVSKQNSLSGKIREFEKERRNQGI